MCAFVSFVPVPVPVPVVYVFVCAEGVCDVIVTGKWDGNGHRIGKAPRQIRSCLSPVFFLPAIVGLRHMFGRVHSLWVNDYSTVLCV